MILNENELKSPVWEKIKDHLESRIESYRKQNDANLPFDETCRLRGRIAEAQAILSSIEPEPITPVNDNPVY